MEVRAEDVAPLKLNNVIGDPVKEPKIEKVSDPEVKKVIEPQMKKRGRRARNSAK